MNRRLRLSMHNRLLLVALLPAILITALVTSLVLTGGTRALDDALHQRGLSIVSFLAPAAEYEVISANRDTLGTLVQAAMDQRDVAAVAIYNNQGDLLASAGRFAPIPLARLQHISSPTIRRDSVQALNALAPVWASAIPLDDFSSSAPALQARPSGQLVGWVSVELDTAPLQRSKNNVIAATIGLLLVALLVTAYLAVRLARSVSTPVARLVRGVSEMASGSLDVELPERASISELAALERGFNTMARAIAESHRTLQARVDEATAQLAHQARHDPLTGLPNRRVFEEALEQSVAASRRSEDHGALCFIDLDRFKIVNDTCGHAAGDDLLTRIATLLRKRVRAQDQVCRVGGDEFALILRGCTREDALRIGESLREGIAAFRFTWDERRFSVGASIGVVFIDGSHHSASEVLSDADSACYEAKKNGRNQVIAYQARAAQRAGDAALRSPPAGASGGTLDLYAQAIAPLGSSSRDGWFEILLRLRDEHGELHSPADYYARFEQTGSASELDLQVAERACAKLVDMQAMSADGDRISLSLNVCRASVLSRATVLAQLTVFFERYQLAPERIVLELGTELLDQLPSESLEFASAAREYGCRFALQQLDGGGVRHLSRFQPDYVKISLRSLIAAYGLEAGCNLAQALAGMAASQGIKTIATEVEDPALLETLHAFGFDFAQGFAVAPPVSTDTWRPPTRTAAADG